MGRGRQHLELPKLQRADPRGPGRGALEPAASAGDTARVLRGAAAGRPPGPRGGLHRLHDAYAEQIRPFIPAGRAYKVLGTDGFGRSDFRSKLREHFEINRHYIVVAALKALSEQGTVPAAKVAEAIAKYGIKADKTNPLYA